MFAQSPGGSNLANGPARPRPPAATVRPAGPRAGDGAEAGYLSDEVSPRDLKNDRSPAPLPSSAPREGAAEAEGDDPANDPSVPPPRGAGAGAG